MEYQRIISYGTVMSLEQLNSLGAEGWKLCAAVKVTDNSYNYLFVREKK